jgi:hypothetical protein
VHRIVSLERAWHACAGGFVRQSARALVFDRRYASSLTTTSAGWVAPCRPARPTIHSRTGRTR